jgi:hypothetical protein
LSLKILGGVGVEKELELRLVYFGEVLIVLRVLTAKFGISYSYGNT